MNKFFTISLLVSVATICGCITEISGQSQQTKLALDENARIIPPSPTAASLAKYGDWPVGYFTGTPNIQVPLYNIVIGKLSLPIGLSYHATGLKVEEVPSWVGAGWSLNAGGAISRTVFGAADENTDLFSSVKIKGKYLPETFNVATNPSQYNIFTKIIGDLGVGMYDSEPDIFFLNFVGKSGKLFMDEDGVFHSIPHNALQIKVHPVTSLTPKEYRYWEIVDEDGVTYILGKGLKGTENAITTIYPPPLNLPTPLAGPTTAWYLNEIISADKIDTIHFEYLQKSEGFAKKASQSYRVPLVKYGNATLSEYGYGYNENVKQGVQVGDNTTSYTGNARLSRIYWRDGEVRFTANTQRQDISGTLLDAVEIFDGSGSKIKSYAFFYDNNTKRLFLNKVYEEGSNGQQLPPYSFDYFAGMPDRYSNAQDYWGYYNGAYTNTHLIPYESILDNFYNTSMLGGVPNANRNPSEDAMKAGTLSKITYPTGGYTSFEFEANKYFEAGDNSYLSVINEPGSYVQDTYLVESVDEVLYPNPSNLKTKDILISKNQLVSIAIDFKNYRKGAADRDSWLPVFTFERVNGDGTLTLLYQYNGFENFDNATKVYNSTTGTWDMHFDLNGISLSAGSYRLSTLLNCYKPNAACGHPTPATSSRAVITYQKYVPPSPVVENSKLCGGLRIKKITDYDNLNNSINERSFEYQKNAEVNSQNVIVSSGRLLSRPVFSCISKQPFAPGRNEGCQLCTYVDVCDLTPYDLSVTGISQGPHIGYSQVKEFFKGGENGYKLYQYSMYNDEYNDPVFDIASYGSYGRPVFMPTTSNEYKRGLLLNESTYKKAGPDYGLLTQVTNEYNFNDVSGSPNFYLMKALKVKRLADSVGTSLCYDLNAGACNAFNFDSYKAREFAYGFYYLKSCWIQQTKKTEVLYGDDGQNAFTTVTNYFYDNPAHLQLSREETYTSKGEKVTTVNKYPLDYTGITSSDNISSAVANLQSLHVLNVPIEKSIYVSNDDGTNQRLKSSLIQEHKPDKPLLSVIYALENRDATFNFMPSAVVNGAITKDNRYKPQLFNNSYDSKNRLTEQQKANDVKEVYLWGYNSTYPVAKIVGTDYATALSKITNQSVLDSPSTDDALRAELNKLRSIPGALVTTYTYKPLVGMTSATDPSGKTVFYEYDGFQRLKLIRDQDGKIVKQFDYKYQNQ